MGARRGWALALLAAVALVLAACTGVPTSSSPEIVRTLPVGGGEQQPATVAPSPGVAPRNLVEEFLNANALDASQHSSARAFLSPAARSQWTDTTVTVVASITVGLSEPSTPSIVVRGRVLGTVDANGVYTPSLQPQNAARRPFVYGITRVDGQYRISSLRDGLLLTESQFLSSFTQRSVYFFDLAHRYLVPDPRWTSLTDPTQLSDWLMSQIAGGPVAGLVNAVDADTLPPQAGARRITVSVGSISKIDIPGSSELSGVDRDRLAAQVANTLSEALRGRTLEITDGPTAVRIPSAGATEFVAATFSAQLGPLAPVPHVYFLRSGKVVDGDTNEVLSGAVDNGKYYLQSLAITQLPTMLTPTIAGVVQSGSVQRLVVGTQSGGLHPTPVRGTLSRPAFAPGRSEVWVGDGTQLFAVEIDGSRSRVVNVGLPPAAAGGRIIALRLSSEGSRIALVIRSGSGEQQLYVGAIVRSAGQIRVDTIEQVSPEDVVVTDLAWVEPSKLIVVGYPMSTPDAEIYDVGSDGSDWTDRGIGNLPDPPTTVTVTVGQPAWVTASGAVWQQNGGNSWVSPGPAHPTVGYAPVYIE